MDEELIKQIARDAANGPHGYAHEIAERALRLYHARAVAPLVEVLDEAYGELVADSTRDGARCLLLTQIEKALAPFQQEANLRREETGE